MAATTGTPGGTTGVSASASSAPSAATRPADDPPEYGALYLILGTASITLLAMLFAAAGVAVDAGPVTKPTSAVSATS